MKEYFSNLLTEFKKFNTYQKVAAVILMLSIPLCLGMGVSAVSQYSDDDSSRSSSMPQSSTVVSSAPQSSSQSSSSSKQSIEVFLIPASIEEDLEVQVVDKDGELVLGPTFTLHVKCASNGYSKKWNVEGDGFLRLPTIPSGTYTVTMEEMDGYIVPTEAVTVKVEKKVDYEKLDVSDKVVDESQVDVSKEDAAYDDAPSSAATPVPELKDTVKYVESSSKKVMKDVEVITYKYKATTLDDGTIKTKDGKSSGLYPVVDKDGYVTGAYKLESPVQSTAVSAQTAMLSLMTLSLDLPENQPAVIDNEEGEPERTEEPEQTAEPTPAPTQEPTPTPTEAPTPEPTQEVTPTPAPTPTPTQEPTPTPTQEPTPTPTQDPTPTPTQEPTPTPTQEPTPTPSQEPSPSPTVEPSPSLSPSPSPSTSPSPSPSVSPSPSPSPVKKEVEIFDDEGKPLAALNLMLTEHEFKTVEKQEVTVYYGWQTLDGKRYYFDKNGEKVTGTQVIKGVTYYFDKEGVMGSRIGIDVSKYQRDIDWKAVKKSGVEFAIIRVGYRGYGSGALVEDPYFRKNIKNATAAGLKVGVYIFSQAISTKEAVEEASMCLDAVKGYKLAYPIFFDTEYSTSRKTGRADSLTKSQRTKIANAFCETIQNSGYQAGVYSSASWFSYQLDYSTISKYDIWVAHYGVETPAMGSKHYDIWQYTGSGTCAGVPGAVDMNIGYTAY